MKRAAGTPLPDAAAAAPEKNRIFLVFVKTPHGALSFGDDVPPDSRGVFFYAQTACAALMNRGRLKTTGG